MRRIGARGRSRGGGRTRAWSRRWFRKWHSWRQFSLSLNVRPHKAPDSPVEKSNEDLSSVAQTKRQSAKRPGPYSSGRAGRFARFFVTYHLPARRPPSVLKPVAKSTRLPGSGSAIGAE